MGVALLKLNKLERRKTVKIKNRATEKEKLLNLVKMGTASWNVAWYTEVLKYGILLR